MYLNQIPAGIKIPDDIYVIIEIPSQSNTIKYEINKKLGAIFVDRFIPTPMFYPCNYGYINNTVSLDGDPIDVLVPTPYPIQSGCVIRCRPVGMLNMIDDAGEDVKVIAVPHIKISKNYELIQNIDDLSDNLKQQIIHFFEHYKDLENNRWTKIKCWENAKTAKLEILNAFLRSKKINNTK